MESEAGGGGGGDGLDCGGGSVGVDGTIEAIMAFAEAGKGCIPGVCGTHVVLKGSTLRIRPRSIAVGSLALPSPPRMRTFI